MSNPSNRVGIAELLARLSHYLKADHRGRSWTVYDRDTPVARVVPYESEPVGLKVRKPLGSLSDVRLPKPLGPSVRSLEALLEERGASGAHGLPVIGT